MGPLLRVALTIVAVGLVLIPGVAIVQMLEGQRRADHRADVVSVVDAHTNDLQQRLDRSLGAVQQIAALIRQNKRLDDFDASAADLLASFDAVRQLSAAPDGEVQATYPADVDPLVSDLMASDRTADAVRRSVSQRALVLSGPIAHRGETVFMGIQPVFLPDDTGRERLWGLVSALLSLETLLEQADLAGLTRQGFDHRLSYRDAAPDPATSATVLSRSIQGDFVAPVRHDLTVSGATWTLAVSPRAGWRTAGSAFWLEIGLVVALASLIAWIVFVGLRQPAVLRAQVAARTAELAQANRDLEASEAWYRLLAEHSTDMISRHSWDGTYRYASPACERLLGYDAAELAGRSAYEFFHPDDLAAIRRSHEGIIERPTVETIRYRIQHKDGAYIWFETTSKTVTNPETGDIDEIIAVSRDISRRKRAEDALARQERRVRALYEVSSRTDAIEEQIEATLAVGKEELGLDVALVSRIEGETYTVSYAYPPGSGFRPGDVHALDETYADLGPPDERVVAIEHMAQSDHCAHPSYARFGFESYIGAPLWVNDAHIGTLCFLKREPRPRPFDETDRQFVRLMSRWVSSMLERKSVADERRRFISLVENSSEFVGMSTLDGQAFFVNQAGRQLVGMPADLDVAETEIQDYHTPEMWRRMRDEILPHVLAHGAWQGDWQLRHMGTGAPLDVAMNLFLVRDPDTAEPMCFATVQRDIRERKRVERMQDEFVSTVSHELRTPLTSIKGYADLMLSESAGTLNADQQGFLEVMTRNTERLTALINDLLTFNRLDADSEAMAMDVIDLSRLLAEVGETYDVSARAKGLDLRLELESGISVRGDPGWLAQAFGNLVSNAIKYTPDGAIGIRANGGPRDKEIQVEVWDTGIGLASEDEERLFERFYRAAHPVVQDAGGTGLGLAIVKTTVEAHGGRIDVCSTSGQGSVFTVYLPRAADRPACDHTRP